MPRFICRIHLMLFGAGRFAASPFEYRCVPSGVNRLWISRFSAVSLVASFVQGIALGLGSREEIENRASMRASWWTGLTPFPCYGFDPWGTVGYACWVSHGNMKPERRISGAKVRQVAPAFAIATLVFMAAGSAFGRPLE